LNFVGLIWNRTTDKLAFNQQNFV